MVEKPQNLIIIILWQENLSVNPSLLIGSVLVVIFPYEPFPWKRHEPINFSFRRPESSVLYN